jgi:hypothetical protein
MRKKKSSKTFSLIVICFFYVFCNNYYNTGEIFHVLLIKYLVYQLKFINTIYITTLTSYSFIFGFIFLWIYYQILGNKLKIQLKYLIVLG